MTEATRIDRLNLSNFRVFADFEIDFHPKLTVLVARNGMGKTAVLDACAVALRYFVDTMLHKTGSLGFGKHDVRRARDPEGRMVHQLPVTLDASGSFEGHRISWCRRLGSLAGKTTYADANELAGRASRLLTHLSAYADRRQSEAPELPVIAYYGTGRLWSEGRISKRKADAATGLATATDAYLDCLDPRSGFQMFKRWFEAVSLEALRRATDPDAAPSGLIDGHLQAVRRATDHVLREVGWHTLQWNMHEGEVVAKHAECGELPVSQLSDGVRNVIALVADLAHRCARLNPQHRAEAPARTAGIVLIDEVDMHLHPSWQQVILPSLCEAFPRVQFIVTTHSPQVLSTVPHECIRVLDGGPEDFRVTTPSAQTEGVPSQDVMAVVMGVASTPDLPIRRSLEAYRAHIQDGSHETDAALSLRVTLVSHFGPQHPEVIDLDRLIRFRQLLATRAPGRPA